MPYFSEEIRLMRSCNSWTSPSCDGSIRMCAAMNSKLDVMAVCLLPDRLDLTKEKAQRLTGLALVSLGGSEVRAAFAGDFL